MRCVLFFLIGASSFMVSAANVTEDNLRPGLWQITTSSDLLWLAPQISPERMRELQDLAEQYGVEMPQIQMGEATSKVCITQEMAEQQKFPIFYQSELGCETRNATRDGNKYRLDFACSGPELKGKGNAEGTITSSESFSGRTHFDGEAQGVPVNEYADISGRWVDASCGMVKPM